VLLLMIQHRPATAQQPQPPPPVEPRDDAALYVVEDVATGLKFPTGLAVRPSAPAEGPFELYFSESSAGRVVRTPTDKSGDVLPVITGFPLGHLADDPAYAVGPLGLTFITRTKLAVGTGGMGEGADLVRVYALPEDGSPVGFEPADHAVGPVPASDRSKSGEGSFFALAKIEDEVEKALYATGRGDDQRGWLLKASLDANRLVDLQPFIATRGTTGVARPTAVTVNPKPRSHYLVVGQMGELGSDRDSVVAFFGPASGEMALQLETGLFDIAGLAYSPSGDLYAVDLAWAEPAAGGVYRIEAAEVDGRQSCRAVKIAAVQRPSSLVFTPDGILYVTALGAPANANDAATGKLLKIAPAPETPKL
jgi:hypothetical protein